MLLSVFPYLCEAGNGVIYDYAIYYITTLVSILGPVDRVGSMVRTPYPQHVNVFPPSSIYGQTMDTPNESQVNAIIRLENSVTGTLHIDADSLLSDEGYFNIYGTKGILMLTDCSQFGGEIKFIKNSTDYRIKEEPIILWDGTIAEKNLRGIGPSDMADAIMSNGTCRPSAELAYHVQEVLTALQSGGVEGDFVNISSTCKRPEPLLQNKI